MMKTLVPTQVAFMLRDKGYTTPSLVVIKHSADFTITEKGCKLRKYITDDETVAVPQSNTPYQTTRPYTFDVLDWFVHNSNYHINIVYNVRYGYQVQCEKYSTADPDLPTALNKMFTQCLKLIPNVYESN